MDPATRRATTKGTQLTGRQQAYTIVHVTAVAPKAADDTAATMSDPPKIPMVLAASARYHVEIPVW